MFKEEKNVKMDGGYDDYGKAVIAKVKNVCLITGSFVLLKTCSL